MKFCEKLQKLRKEKGYSQEELADMLEVSRQSVSKWESGTTYPEMDKLISLCKIFNCTLDDLTNDEVSTTKINEKNKNNFSNLVDAILDMINKSIEMFKNMSFKETIKVIIELGIIFLILLLFKIPFNILDDSVYKIFANFDYNVLNTLNSIWLFLSNTIYLVLFIIIFLYIYKTRFLDSFKPQEKKEEEVIEQIEEKENEKIIKPKKEKREWVVIDFLSSIFNIFIKFCLVIFGFPMILFFVSLCIITILCLLVNFIGIHYIGLFILFLGCTIVCYIITELIMRFLFNSSFSFKRLFFTFIGGLIIASLGTSIFLVEFYNSKYYDVIPSDIVMSSKEEIIPMTEDLIITNHYKEINYEYDESLTDTIKITINYYEDYMSFNVKKEGKYLRVNFDNDFENVKNALNLIKENLKDKTFFDYDLLYDYEITITTSQANYEKLMNNRNNYIENIKREEEKYDYYLGEIERLELELERKDENIEELEETIEELREKLNNIEEQFH